MTGKTFCGLAAALFAFGIVCQAQPDEVQDLGPKIFQAQWVSVDKLPGDASSIIPFPWGNDPLRDGEIEVRAKGQVKVDLEGVEPEAEYTLWVCKLSSAAVGDRCAELGKVMTDDKGKAGTVIPWPSGATGPFAVFFVLTRSQTTMFVSGFHMPSGVPPVTGIPPTTGGTPPPSPKPEWKEVELKGPIANIAGNTFTVLGTTVTVNDETRFVGRVKEFSDLQAGMIVEVSGVTTPGGVVATRVQVSGKI